MNPMKCRLPNGRFGHTFVYPKMKPEDLHILTPKKCISCKTVSSAFIEVWNKNMKPIIYRKGIR